jgi:hypothetical protein
MSIHSKAKRDARRKKTAKAAPARPLVEHAHLVDGRGGVFGGAVQRGREWVLVLGGKPAARTDSAAMVLAMLTHVAALRETAGDAVRLSYSTQLRDAATAEAAAEGKTLDDYLAQLEAERAERDEASETVPDPSDTH